MAVGQNKECQAAYFLTLSHPQSCPTSPQTSQTPFLSPRLETSSLEFPLDRLPLRIGWKGPKTIESVKIM